MRPGHQGRKVRLDAATAQALDGGMLQVLVAGEGQQRSRHPLILRLAQQVQPEPVLLVGEAQRVAVREQVVVARDRGAFRVGAARVGVARGGFAGQGDFLGRGRLQGPRVGEIQLGQFGGEIGGIGQPGMLVLAGMRGDGRGRAEKSAVLAEPVQPSR